MHVCVRMYIRVYTCVRTHTYIHVHITAHRHTQRAHTYTHSSYLFHCLSLSLSQTFSLSTIQLASKHVRTYMSCVRTVQRSIKSFLVCKKCRIEAMLRIWSRNEKTYVRVRSLLRTYTTKHFFLPKFFPSVSSHFFSSFFPFFPFSIKLID